MRGDKPAEIDTTISATDKKAVQQLTEQKNVPLPTSNWTNMKPNKTYTEKQIIIIAFNSI